MYNYPVINNPNQEVVLDFSKIDTQNWAESEILVVVSSDKTTVVIPQAIQVNGNPSIYILGAGKSYETLKVKLQQPDTFMAVEKFSEFDFNGSNAMIKIKKIGVGFGHGNIGAWLIESKSQ